MSQAHNFSGPACQKTRFLNWCMPMAFPTVPPAYIKHLFSPLFLPVCRCFAMQFPSNLRVFWNKAAIYTCVLKNLTKPIFLLDCHLTTTVESTTNSSGCNVPRTRRKICHQLPFCWQSPSPRKTTIMDMGPTLINVFFFIVMTVNIYLRLISWCCAKLYLQIQNSGAGPRFWWRPAEPLCGAKRILKKKKRKKNLGKHTFRKTA